MSEAEALGSMLGLFVRHGATAIQDAVAALKRGQATHEQQLICADIIHACSLRT